MEIQCELQPEDEPDIALPLLVVNLVNQAILGKTVTQMKNTKVAKRARTV